MKKLFLLSLAAAAMMFAGCSKEAVEGSDGEVTTTVLKGTWSIKVDRLTNTLIFTDDTYTLITENSKEEGSYTLSDGKLTTTPSKEYTRQANGEDAAGNITFSEWQEMELSDEDKTPVSASVSTFGGGSVLVVIPDMEYVDTEDMIGEAFSFYYKEGKTISADASALKGLWNSNSSPDKSLVASLEFSGEKCTFIIPAWAVKHVGTYSYSNGYLTINIEESYTCRGADGLTTFDYETNTAEWREPGEYDFVFYEDSVSLPFVIKESKSAYGMIDGLSLIFDKQ